MTTTAASPGSHVLHCMEIWGGCEPVEKTLITPGLDAWVHSRPYEGAASGGDVHYVSLCGGGVLTRLIVADVSGHGLEVSECSRSLRDLMRENINRKSQSRLVRELNRQFTEMAQMRQFATAIVATYLATRDRLTVSNAGHPRPLWYRALTREWSVMASEVLGVSNLPLGIDEETPYEQFMVALGKGDLVLFYTDALTEAQGPDGRLLGEQGLLDLARALPVDEPHDVGPALLAAVERHRGGQAADDDVTLLALHHNAGPPRRLSIGEKLDVYAKVFGLKAV